LATLGFEFLNMLDGGNPVIKDLPLNPDESYERGDMVVASGGRLTKAAPGASAVVGVMQETITAAHAGVTYGKVLVSPQAVYRCSYAGTWSTANLLAWGMDLADAHTVQVDDMDGGPLAAIAVDTDRYTVDVVIVDHLFKG